jgi:lipoprotein-releasing system ATP-binding protein
MTILVAEHVEKRYRNGPEELRILRDVSLEVEEGSIVVITGESGSGKSTLLNLIGGLDAPTGGEIHAAGYHVSRLPESGLTEYRARVTGLVFQFHYLLKDFTALENVMLPLYMAGVPKKEAVRKAERLLEDVRLSDRRNHYPSQLSGGERQRAAVARALVTDPKLVLADEPTGNLDEGNSRVIAELLFSLVRTYGKTLILVTHDRALAGAGDRRFHLAHGELSVV